MKKKPLTTKEKDKLESLAKTELILESQRDFMLSSDETIKGLHQETLGKIIQFYQNEYIPIIQKHAEIMSNFNKLNIALRTRKIYSSQQIIEFNSFLDKKLKEMFDGKNS